MQEIETRIRSAGDRTKYPLLMIGIFVELERERLVSMADQLLDGFTLRSENLENGSWDPSIDMSKEKTQEYLALCLQSRSLIDHMKAVKRQVVKLLAEIEEFEGHFPSHRHSERSHDGKRAHRFKKIGAQMKKRLQDTINEYDGKIDECNMIVGNITLAMQTVSHTQPFLRDPEYLSSVGLESNCDARFGPQYSHCSRKHRGRPRNKTGRHPNEVDCYIINDLLALFQRRG